MSNFQTIKIENIDKNITVLFLNREKSLNALNALMLSEINFFLDNLQNTRVLIITGSGKAFAAGADIKEMSENNSFEARSLSELGNKVFRKIEKLKIPVIAAVNGFALGGGCELSLACDFRIASDYAKFGQPEVSLGITPGFGGTQRLARIINPAKAKELIYTGQIINADEAEKLGLVNYVFSPNELLSETIKIAKNISKNSSIAVTNSKQAIDSGLQLSIDEALNLEAQLFGMCFSHNDQKEGMMAFIEKRKPEFF